MVDLISENLRLFVAIGGLLLLLLVVGSLAQKYEQYSAAKRHALQRLLVVTRQIEEALEKSRGGGLPAGAGKLLRNELLARYITVHQLYPRYPRINQLIAQAEERARMEPEGSASVNPAAFTSIESLNLYLAALNRIYGLLNGATFGQRLSATDRKALQLKLVEFQLSAASHYYTGMANDAARAGEWSRAVRAARALDSYIMTRPRSSALATRLKNDARALLLAMSSQRLPDQHPATASQSRDA